MKKRDYILILIVVIFALTGILINNINTSNYSGKNHIVIYKGEEVFKKSSLEVNKSIIVKYDNHYNEIEIKDSMVRMKKANCKNQDCINQRAMIAENIEQRILQNWIICLPNEVSIELIKSNEAN